MAESREGLWMSAKERDRLKVLHEVQKRHIHQKPAAAELGLSVRWLRKLLVRLRAGGDAGLRHGLRGRQSNRKTPETVKQRAVELYRQKKQAQLWHDYGPTLAVEELAEQHGITLSRETLRKWLIETEAVSEILKSRPMYGCNLYLGANLTCELSAGHRNFHTGQTFTQED